MIKLIKSIQQIKFASNRVQMSLLVLWPAVSHNTGTKNFPGEDSLIKWRKKSGILLWEESHTSVSPGKSTADLLTEAHGFGLLSNN